VQNILQSWGKKMVAYSCVFGKKIVTNFGRKQSTAFQFRLGFDKNNFKFQNFWDWFK
jgi:hypothetical protein